MEKQLEMLLNSENSDDLYPAFVEVVTYFGSSEEDEPTIRIYPKDKAPQEGRRSNPFWVARVFSTSPLLEVIVSGMKLTRDKWIRTL